MTPPSKSVLETGRTSAPWWAGGHWRRSGKPPKERISGTVAQLQRPRRLLGWAHGGTGTFVKAKRAARLEQLGSRARPTSLGGLSLRSRRFGLRAAEVLLGCWSLTDRQFCPSSCWPTTGAIGRAEVPK